MVGSSYNEPLITAEWAVDVFKAARPAGLKTAFVSNGNATPEVLDYIRPWTDCYKIDLKAMDDKALSGAGRRAPARRRRHPHGPRAGVLARDRDFDRARVQRRRRPVDPRAELIASVSPEIPWHVTAFHKDYKMTDPENTPVATLLRACEIGTRRGCGSCTRDSAARSDALLLDD